VCAQTKKQKQLGMVAEKPICGKRRHGFRKVVAALCKIGELEGARENTNERRLHHFGLRTDFEYTHACLAIYFPNYVPSNERRSLYERLQFLCTRPNTLMGKSWNFSSSRKLIEGQLEILCKACFYKCMSSYDYVHFLHFLSSLFFKLSFTRTKR
jgi:hypothetical protein